MESERIEKLEKRIEELEKDRDKQRARKLSKAVIVSPDPLYRVKIEEMYSEANLTGKYKQFDFKKAVNGANEKRNRDQKLEYWYAFYGKLKAVLGDQYGQGFWMDLCYLVEKIIDYYENDVIKYILKEGKYIDTGGAPNYYNKAQIIALWERLKDTTNRMAVYGLIADEIGIEPQLSDRTKRIQQIILKHERGK